MINNRSRISAVLNPAQLFWLLFLNGSSMSVLSMLSTYILSACVCVCKCACACVWCVFVFVWCFSFFFLVCVCVYVCVCVCAALTGLNCFSDFSFCL